MSIDDEDSKIRRNLVVASMVILLAVWVRAPLEGLAEALLKVKPGTADFAWRVWLAGIALLGYFCLRFRFSTQYLEAITPMQVEYLAVEQRVLRAWLGGKLKQFLRTGKAGRLDVSGVSEILEKQRAGIVTGRKGGDVKVAAIRVRAANRASTKYPPAAALNLNYIEAQCSVSFTTEGGMAGGTDLNFGLDLPKLAILRIRCSSYGWMLLYSKGSTQVLLPWILAGLALLAAIYKAVRTW